MKKIELINEVIKPIINEYNYTATKKNISLKFIPGCDKFNVHGDAYSLIQIFSNLLDNAIKYTNYGSVTISTLLNEKNEIQVSVSDTGIGISEDFLPNLFEPFRQEEQGYSRTYDGNGIGLALVKKYCDINDVIIEVKSVKTIGTTFILYFKNAD